MSDTADSSSSPFASFSTAPGFDMFEKMWRMMQVPGLGSTPSPSSMISGMMAPMTNIDELDKRITDMRAVEQWLKLNLSMLQSAIQALEVQRATLATLKAFGAFAQSSMEQAAAKTPETSKTISQPVTPAPAASPASAKEAAGAGEAGEAAPVDATPWWNLLQAQFNQIAGLALAAQSAPLGAADASAKPTAKSAAKPAAKTSSAAKPAAKTTVKPATKTTPPKSGAAPKKS